MKRRRNFWLLVLVAAVAIGTAGYLFLAERPLAVPVATAQRDVPVRVYGLGTVEARIVSRIGFEVGAALTDLAVDSGDAVAEGQVLARLHTAEQEARVVRAEAAVEAAGAALGKAEANVERARAVLAQRRSTNDRQQALADRRTISVQTAEEAQRDVDVAAADLAVAESEVKVAQAQRADAEAALLYETTLLDHHVLRAPFDAVVVTRHVETGTVVRAGDPIFTLMDPGTVWTLAYIDEARAGSIAAGQPAEVRLRSLPHEVFGGTVDRIGIESDRVNEERRVWIACDRCPAEVYLGEQAEVRITVATLPEALLVPEIAVRGFDGHRGRVWYVQDGRLAETEVIFGHRTEDARVEVISGLPEGAKVVAVPVKGLTEGRMARITGDAP
ncbi:efflux RND transporter periplasmic adaptor subunit [Ruegeria pomeroyi]|uniref:Efflux RND transporter periplasmic adaptor subunit n=1 Tax=Ruegeria pomeroyi TaxID=89184 RepID=A0A9Q3WM75_9RHOB|nr:efflux RND transporter periplasmic adaptor subunit [Ruegeria pomeroyi]MCE8512326.1 efflux RND transporter periplasmic adaptor subunit [Ruegeria pomeroyi]MCE8537957.1 efflux RND transporter periplasmic adaptor subunit [Ruegeria pomeroyi]MCE8556281.1 efflux RND transporter periplasmic adaptor subunit [Ruegeria pomeroyi]